MQISVPSRNGHAQLTIEQSDNVKGDICTDVDTYDFVFMPNQQRKFFMDISTVEPFEPELIHFKPRTELGRRILELRAKYKANGGTFLPESQIQAHLDESRRRGI